MDITKKCLICDETYDEMIKYRKSGRYRIQVLKLHLEHEHNISVVDYIKRFNICEIPKCACGCGNSIDKVHNTSKLEFVKYIDRKHQISWNKGLTKENNAIIKRIADSRCGKDNPAYGLTPWNKGLTKESSERVATVAKKITGLKASRKTKRKQSLSAIKRFEVSKHPMTGKTHSKKTKQLLSEYAIKQCQLGSTRSNLEVEVENVLIKSKVKFKRQIVLSNYVYDFAIKYLGDWYLLEVHGDFWHYNPRIPINKKRITKVQIKNLNRDVSKEQVLKSQSKYKGLIILWESEVNKTIALKKIALRLKKLNQSKRLVCGGFTTLRCNLADETMLRTV